MPAARQHTVVAFVTVALLAALAVAGAAGGVELPRKRDREAPTAPANVRVTAAAPSSVSLEWDAATDNVEVSFYYVYVDAQRARVSGTKYTAANLACGQSVGVWVVAYDSSLNRSPSAAATVSTAACPDAEAPTPPASFRQVATAQDAVVLAWTPSTDDVGVVGYGVYRDQLPVKTTSEPSADLAGLACGSTYEFQVDSVDAAGNRSERRSAWVQTADCVTRSPIAAGEWTFCAWESERCVFSGTKEVRYGEHGIFTEPRTFSNIVSCSNSVFGDPLPGVGKRCEYRDPAGTPPPPPPPPSPPPAGAWAFCAWESERCVFSGTKEIRYGEHGTFTEPRAFSNGISCSNSVFGDPLPGVGKRCEYRDPAGTPPPPDTPPSDKTPPSQPAGFTAANVTRTSVSLRWQPSSDNVGVVSYDVYKNGTKVVSVSSTSSDQGGLACGTLYWFGVEAVDGAGNRSARTRTSATTSACATPPTGWTFCAWESERCTFSGTKEVRYGANSTFTAPRVFSNGVSCSNSIFGDPLPGVGKRCEYRDLGGLPPPPSDDLLPDRTPPSQPADLAVASVTGTSVSLTWSASTDNVGVTGYGVYVNGSNALTANQPGATVSNLACGTAFTFAVDAVDAANNRSAKAQVTAATAPCGAADTQAPTVPTNVAASSRNATSIALTWTASTDNVGVTGYGLYRNGTLVGTANTTTGIFSGLTCNTNYTLAVDAQDAAGNRSGKATLMVATTGCADTTAPSAPTGLAASNVTRSSLTLTWNAATDNVGVVSYDVYRNGTKMENTGSRSSSQTGLACATSYWFGVEALDAAGNRSARTNVNATTTACEAPPPPPPGSWSGPITITRGGTYTGSWESTSGAPAVVIDTAEPVTITGSRIRNLAGGSLIKGAGGGYTIRNLTLENSFLYGGGGRVFDVEFFERIVVRNCTIDKTSGMKFSTDLPGSVVIVTRNKHLNIQRGAGGSFGNFVQFNHVNKGTIEVSWNEIVNVHTESYAEDLMSFINAANAKIHNNYMEGNSSPHNTYGADTLGTITLEDGAHNLEVYENQMVDVATGVFFPEDTHDNVAHHNRLIQDGYLGDTGIRMGNGYSGMTIIGGAANTRFDENVSGFVNRDGDRNDWDPSSTAAGNTTLPNPITREMEKNEWSRWLGKLGSSGVQVGA